MELHVTGGRILATAFFVSALLLAPLSSQRGAPAGSTGLREPSWSHDGKRIAFAVDRGEGSTSTSPR